MTACGVDGHGLGRLGPRWPPLVAPAAAAEIVLGMAAPLLAAVATGAHRRAHVPREPGRAAAGHAQGVRREGGVLHDLVVAMLKGLELQPAPFVVSFVGVFRRLVWRAGGALRAPVSRACARRPVTGSPPSCPNRPSARRTLDAGKVIIDHVSNSSPDHPLIHLPPVFGIDMSVSKHVFMLWLVAALVFVVVTALVRRYLTQPTLVPTGHDERRSRPSSSSSATTSCGRTSARSACSAGRRCC